MNPFKRAVTELGKQLLNVLAPAAGAALDVASRDGQGKQTAALPNAARSVAEYGKRSVSDTGKAFKQQGKKYKDEAQRFVENPVRQTRWYVSRLPGFNLGNKAAGMLGQWSVRPNETSKEQIGKAQHNFKRDRYAETLDMIRDQLLEPLAKSQGRHAPPYYRFPEGYIEDPQNQRPYGDKPAGPFGPRLEDWEATELVPNSKGQDKWIQSAPTRAERARRIQRILDERAYQKWFQQQTGNMFLAEDDPGWRPGINRTGTGPRAATGPKETR